MQQQLEIHVNIKHIYTVSQQEPIIGHNVFSHNVDILKYR